MSNRKETQDYYNNLALSQSELKLLLLDEYHSDSSSESIYKLLNNK